jgi:chorismate dehydratase
LKNEKLKIGRIPYANLFPIFYYLDKKCHNPEFRFINGVPSKLNRMLRSGELDISPSSSIEYLKNKSRYVVLPWLSISSSGPIHSILLFSRVPLEELGGKTIAVSSESDTSVELLKIILREFISLKCRFKTTSLRSVKNILTAYPAVLHIGDTAMFESKKQSAAGSRRSAPYIYDLGELWDKYTGLPFVYALWVVKRKSILHKRDLLLQFSSDLIKAKKYAGKKLSFISKEAPQNKWLTERELVNYWKIISYDFTDNHLEGLRLFEKYIKKR